MPVDLKQVPLSSISLPKRIVEGCWGRGNLLDLSFAADDAVGWRGWGYSEEDRLLVLDAIDEYLATHGDEPSLDESLLVYSPYWGIRQLVGLPGEDGVAGSTAVWDGEEVSYLVTSTLVLLSFEAACVLSVGK